MKILIACEESQAVTIAFRNRGFEAYSCDILPCSGGHPEWHIQGDVTPLLKNKWDLVIAHPPCDYLANSGVRWRVERKEWREVYEGIMFFKKFQQYGERGNLIMIENPIIHKYARDGVFFNYNFQIGVGKHSQTIQPYQFGHLEQKRTCLWLYGLPKLKETNNVFIEMMKLEYKDRAKVHYCPPGKNQKKIRSTTYKGIAEAMAQQWGDFLLNKTTT